jgi:hypothetical protein
MLVAATVVACGTEVVVPADDGPSTTTTTSTSSSGGGGAGGTPFVTSVGPGGTGGAMPECGDFDPITFQVEVPPPGVPARAGQICTVMASPVESNEAARVVLTKYSMAQNLAMGSVTVASLVLPDVVGLPTIEVVETQVPELMPVTITNVAPTMDGFSFHAEWPPFTLPPESWVRMRVQTTMTVKCDPNGMDTRQVQASTWIHLCIEDGDLLWVSSGDDCKVCDVIAEMAPCPIVPDKAGDELGLAQALRLRLVVLARVGSTVVVWAEHDGGAGLAIDWRASGGELRHLADDVVVWTPSEGDQQILCAVQGDDAAAVASLPTKELRQ